MGKMGDTFDGVIQRVLSENKRMSEELVNLRKRFPSIFEMG
jgi:hypothetical protein